MLNKNKDMPIEDFRKSGYELVDWIANYLENVEEFPVVSQVNPGDIKNKLPKYPPQKSEQMSDVFADIDKIIMPGITHWNHPNFMAYFNATSSGPGILAELLIAGLNNNGMLWKTSPALTELEEVTLNWFREMIQLPEKFWGIIYDLASISSLHAIAAAREQAKETNSNFNLSKLRIYTSEHAHSSIEKAVKTLGLSDSALVKIKVDNSFKMIPHELQKAIKEDLENDLQPFCIVATIGTTSTTSIDPVEEIVKINDKYKLWLHVDAAYAGTAAILPELNYILNDVEKADSIVINPHKWLFVPIDLSILYTTKPEILKRAFSIVPEYLKTEVEDKVTNYMDYGIQLGRRFRSIKLWFVIRYFGVEGLQNIIRDHIRLGQKFANLIDNENMFERLAPTPFSAVCFRAVPISNMTEEELNDFNKTLMDEINDSGKLYLSHTKLNGKFTIRLVVSGIRTTEANLDNAWKLIKEKFNLLKTKQD